MTQRLDPTIILRRLVATMGGEVVLDMSFHEGVNIIAGPNGSGKSSVTDLIFFALGGDSPKFKEEAAACDFVFAEVGLNGATATLRREVSPQLRRPMAITWQPYDEARTNAIEGWELFPFNATPSKRSFSQVLFEALGVPEALQGDLSSHVTMHQVLRLVYVDQETPFSVIFRTDHWDSPVIRSGVGDLLLGLYEPALYTKRIKLAEHRKELAQVDAEYNGARRVLKQVGEERSVEELLQEQDAMQDKLDASRAKLAALESAAESGEGSEAQDAVTRRVELRKLLSKAAAEEKAAIDGIEALTYDIQDAELFIVSLNRRLAALEEAQEMQDALGVATFTYCPSCLAIIEPDAKGDGCHLCGSGEGGRSIARNVAKLRHELSMQLGESAGLQEKRISERDELATLLPGLQLERRRLQAEYDESTEGVRSAHLEELTGVNREIGYATRHLQELVQRVRVARVVEELGAKGVELRTQIAMLEAQIREALSDLDDARGEREKVVGEIAADVLRQDVPTEFKFQMAERVTFDFGEDALAVGGKSVFAASSSVLLKNAFHLALLLASTRLPGMRYPRIWLCDNIEDKGMVAERSQNFQRLVVAGSRSAGSVHQIIFATSMLAPDLDDPALVVAHLSVPEKSIRIPRR